MKLLRWILTLPAAVAAAYLCYLAAQELTAALGLEAPHWGWVVIKLYAYLLIGFLFTGVGTKIAPGHKDAASNVLVFLSVAAGAWIMFTCPEGTVIGITLGLAIVAGAAGYGMRMRGFGPTRKYA